jgi:hypothetical protein
MRTIILPITHILLIALALAGVFGCRKDVEELRPYSASQSELSQLLSQVPNTATRTTFLLSGPLPDTVLTTSSGLRIHLTDTEALFALTSSGALVPCSSCQQLKIEITEVIRKGDLLARQLPTIDNDNRWLESIGAVSISVTCDGQALNVLPGRNLKIQIPANATQADFVVFNGQTQGGVLKFWTNTQQPVYEAEWPIGNSQIQKGYEILATQTGWVSGQKLLVTNDYGSFCVEMGGQFAAENTQVYVVLKNKQSVIILEAQADPVERKYCFNGAPPGYLVRIVTVSKVGDQYWLGNTETEIGNNGTLTTMLPNKSTAQQIIDFLKNL